MFCHRIYRPTKKGRESGGGSKRARKSMYVTVFKKKSKQYDLDFYFVLCENKTDKKNKTDSFYRLICRRMLYRGFCVFPPLFVFVFVNKLSV